MSVRANLFNLNDIVPSQQISGGASQKSKKSAKPTAEALKNYVEIPKSALADNIGAYIRYLEPDGNLKPGGGKIKAVDDADVTLSNFQFATKKFFVWKVPLTGISKVYKHMKDAKETKDTKETTHTVQTIPAEEHKSVEDQIMSAIGTKVLFNDTDMLHQKISKLENDMQRIDEDLKKVFILVKRLYKGMNATVTQQ